ncbi:MAG: carbon-nitrogen hydrolase family protein [Eubacteriales bacterium]|nr:carbon-nitrogen hydrolase family protein [Eubacteriales bacterium]
MRIGAYSFQLTESVSQNVERFLYAIHLAAEQNVRLLVFPECSLTGYPCEEIGKPDDIDFDMVDCAISQLQDSAKKYGIHLVFGAVEKSGNVFYNSAYSIYPGEKAEVLYRKRALWGWDRDSFQPGYDDGGVISIDGLRFGVRICYEVRFPEYFRELYRQKTDCNLVLFCDRTEMDSMDRYNLIKAHLLTRAVENVTPLVSVNNCAKYQTAPTMAIDEDGNVLAEQPRQEEGLLVFDLVHRKSISFSAEGRRVNSNRLVGETEDKTRAG